jgi:abortive infection bacteriophage resistance protein
MKTATTIEEQIKLLRDRGMDIQNEAQAKDTLLDIGYYRLGFYWFPFEKGFPRKVNRTHTFIEGTTFNNIIALYYFDCDLRNVLSPYLYGIEVNVRTFLTYTVSNFYRSNPTWFADNRIVTNAFINHLSECYTTIRRNEAIKHHHRKYPNDIYAPAWKTLEFMTFGDIMYLFSNLKNKQLQQEIALHYNIKSITVFESYFNTIRLIRNLCAHGHNVYDVALQKSIKSGPLEKIEGARHHNLTGALLVISYILNAISPDRAIEFKDSIKTLFTNPNLYHIKDVILRYTEHDVL